MKTIEKLYQEASDNNIEIYDYSFNSKNIKGLYCDGVIAINNNLPDDSTKQCIIAEELGHHFTSVGNIIDINDTKNSKQEQQARAWAYDRLIGLTGIVDCYVSGCRSKHDMAEHLEVTEEFLIEALQRYKSKYGTYATVDNYIIYFEPNLRVLKIKE